MLRTKYFPVELEERNLQFFCLPDLITQKNIAIVCDPVKPGRLIRFVLVRRQSPLPSNVALN
jgi:hypothetical protein